MIICTIISKNYTAKAKCMLASLKKYYPNQKLEILISDISRDDVVNFFGQDDFIMSNFNIHTVDELDIPDIQKYKEKYGLVEFNTFIKPRFIKMLLKKEDKVVFSDADIFYYNDIQKIDDLLNDNNIILTPHRLFDEEENLNSLKMLEYGYYNLGFIAVSRSEETLRFLDWWHWKLLEYGYLRLEEHLAWDQKWCDLVPIYFDKVHILKDYGYNVAFWNVFERNVSMIGSEYYVNGKERLTFIHFSHYLIEYPMYLRAVPDEDSFTDFPKDSILREIFDKYRDSLIENGHEKYKHN